MPVSTETDRNALQSAVQMSQSGGGMTQTSIAALGRTYGNSYVQALLTGGGAEGDGDSDDDAVASGNKVMRKSSGDGDAEGVHDAARRGTAGGGGALPHADRIQSAFGHHDVSDVQAHVGGAATTANEAMGAEAYATGNDVAFKNSPDLHTAAHETAHVVQQRGGVSLKGGVGQAGDRYEQHADAVADQVVQGNSAEGLLDGFTGASAGDDDVQQHQEAVQREEEGGGGAGGAGGGDGSGGGEGSGPGTDTEEDSSSGSGTKVKIEFYAFIAGSLGSSYSAVEQPTGLSNQAAFDTAAGAVPGTWALEPGPTNVYNPLSGTYPYYFETDNRSWGGGSARLNTIGSVDSAIAGNKVGKTFTPGGQSSQRVYANVDGFSTQTGAVVGPTKKSASIGSSETCTTNGNETTITIKNSASYPFIAVAPNIDFKVVVKLTKNASGGVDVLVSGIHNMFPYYELLIDGTNSYRHTPTATGPGMWNLNTSKNFNAPVKKV